MRKIILDLCGGTGSWSNPYRDAGYEVEVITLPQYDVTRVDFDTYAIEFKRMDVHYPDSLCIPCEEVYGILSAPPCTEFSLAKGNAPRDFAEAMRVVKGCLEIIWHCRTHGNPKFWAMENPRGFLRQFLGIPHFTFEQWEFGESQFIKPTDLWGYFRPPKPTIREKPDYKVKTRHGVLFGAPKPPKEYAHLKLDRAAIRAITPPGFAQAFFKANQ